MDCEGKSYTGILKPTVLYDPMNQAASYWSYEPYCPMFSGLGIMPPAPPSGYAIALIVVKEVAYKWTINQL